MFSVPSWAPKSVYAPRDSDSLPSASPQCPDVSPSRGESSTFGMWILYASIVLIIYIYIYDCYYESQPGSWLVAICKRSENRGSGGVVAKRVKIGKIGGNFRQTPDGFTG